MRTKAEQAALLDSAPRPTESTLAWFIRARCRVSGLDLERVPVKEFQTAFHAFVDNAARLHGQTLPSLARGDSSAMRPTASSMNALRIQRAVETVSEVQMVGRTLLRMDEPSMHAAEIRDTERIVRGDGVGVLTSC